MKDAMGELNMTVVTIVAIGAVAAFFIGVLWPQIQEKINAGWEDIGTYDPDHQGGIATHSIVLPDYFDIPNIY